MDLGEKKVIEKQVLRIGKWKHFKAPNGILEVTKDYITKLADNFKRAASPVPVLRGHQDNEEAEKNTDLIISKNIKDVNVKEDGLYVTMEIDSDELEKYNDVSLSINPNYENHETGEKLGDIISHVAMVINPYIKNLKPFIPLKEEKGNYNILLSEILMSDEIKPSETTEEKGAEVVKPTNETPKEGAETIEPVKEEPKTEDVEDVKKEDVALSESDQIRIKLAETEKQNAELKSKILLQEANSTYEKFLREGRILPTMKTEFLNLSSITSQNIDLADGKKVSIQDTLISMFNKLPKFVNLTEKGVVVETGDVNSEMPEQYYSEMESRYLTNNPKATKEDFKAYVEKNKRIIMDAVKTIKGNKNI